MNTTTLRTRGSTYCYELWGDESDPLALYHVKLDRKGFEELRFYRGELISDWPEGITVYVKGQHVEDYLAGLHWHILSERVRQVFAHCTVEGVQFLPIEMRHIETGEKIGQYWVINVMREVDALDWEHTRWLKPEIVETDPYPHLNIIKPAFRREALQGADIFRLQIRGDGGCSIYISRQLKRSLEGAGATSGMRLIAFPAY